jgi:hypothetical protein
MGFYKNFLLGNAIILFLLLGVMMVLLSNTANSQSFPPELSKCPDYYSQTPEDSCVMTQSVYTSRTPACTTLYPKGMSVLNKKMWASGCGVAWDGITNSSII